MQKFQGLFGVGYNGGGKYYWVTEKGEELFFYLSFSSFNQSWSSSLAATNNHVK